MKIQLSLRQSSPPTEDLLGVEQLAVTAFARPAFTDLQKRLLGYIIAKCPIHKDVDPHGSYEVWHGVITQEWLLGSEPAYQRVIERIRSYGFEVEIL